MSTSTSMPASALAPTSESRPLARAAPGSAAPAAGGAPANAHPARRAATRARIEANRRNAKLSTGPRTRAGKDRCSANAVRHGLRAKVERLLIPHEDASEFRSFRSEMRRRLRPADVIERMLVRRAVLAAWRLERCARTEASFYSRDLGMAHHVAMSELPAGQRLKWDEEPHPIVVGMVMGEAMGGPSSPYETLRRYERTMERAFYTALRELERVQNRRRVALGAGHLAEEEEEGRGKEEEAEEDKEEHAVGAAGAVPDAQVGETRPTDAASSPVACCPLPVASSSGDLAQTDPTWDQRTSEWNSFLQGTLRPRRAAAAAAGGGGKTPPGDDSPEAADGDDENGPTHCTLEEYLQEQIRRSHGRLPPTANLMDVLAMDHDGEYPGLEKEALRILKRIWPELDPSAIRTPAPYTKCVRERLGR